MAIRRLLDDLLAAARGALKGRLPTTAALRVKARGDEAAAEDRRR